MTLEEAMAEILKLREENTVLKTNNQNLTNTDSEQKKRILELQELNQKYFLKLTEEAPKKEDPQNKDDDKLPTMEELGQNLYKEMQGGK